MCHRMHFLDLQRLYVFWMAGLTTVNGVFTEIIISIASDIQDYIFE